MARITCFGERSPDGAKGASRGPCCQKLVHQVKRALGVEKGGTCGFHWSCGKGLTKRGSAVNQLLYQHSAIAATNIGATDLSGRPDILHHPLGTRDLPLCAVVE